MAVNCNQIRFGVFEVRRDARELRKHGVRIKLEDQPFEILTALLEKPGDIVTRSELQARLWPEGTFVDFDRSLTKAVHKIRTALGDSAATPRFVETLSGRGYRFIAPVEVVADLVPGPEPDSSSSLPRVTAFERRAWPKWAAVAAVSAAAMGAAILWLSRPLPPPRVTGTVQITNDGRGNGAPMLTDGTRLLFNLAGEPRQVSVKGGESVPLSLPMQNAWLADISPDRTEFLMCRYHDTDRDLERLELWAAPLLGGSPRRLGNLLVTTRLGLDTGNGFPTPRRRGGVDAHQSIAAWSPDGQQLVYARDMELHLARSDGTEVRKLATFVGAPFFVRWSPDGHLLRLSVSNAVLGAGDSAASLWEVSVDDGRVRRLLPGWDPSWYTCCGNWTPDGKYFVFQSRSNIWAIREKGGFFQRASHEPVQLTNGPMAAYWPLPSLDGKRLFIAGYQPRNKFLRYDLQSRRFAPEFAGVSGDNLEFSKDGKWVTYVSVPRGIAL